MSLKNIRFAESGVLEFRGICYMGHTALRIGIERVVRIGGFVGIIDIAPINRNA